VNNLPKVVTWHSGSVPVRSRTCAPELPEDYKSDTLPLDYRATLCIIQTVISIVIITTEMLIEKIIYSYLHTNSNIHVPSFSESTQPIQ